MSERRKAAEVVAAVLTGTSLTEAMASHGGPEQDRGRGLVQELAYGAVRWFPRFDTWIAHLAKRKPREPYIQALLAVGMYQLFHMRVPEHAAVAETVAAAPQRQRGFCNAVLRNAQRRHAELEGMLARDEVARSAHPRWLLESLQRDWPEDWPGIVTANNEQAPMTLRVNRRRIARSEYLDLLALQGLQATPAAHADDGVVLTQAVPVQQLPGFIDGQVSVQDGAAQLAAGLLQAEPGMRVLDACAAPGGKTCHVIERTEGIGEVVAVDSDAARMNRVADNLNRLGLSATLVVGDACEPTTWWDGRQFERILVDAPCSATGVIRRHPDIRLLRRASDIDSLVVLQGQMVDALWPLLAPGGQMLYATCSVLRAENDGVLAKRPTTPIVADWGRATASGRQIFPGEDGMDGFHYACLLKETA